MPKTSDQLAQSATRKSLLVFGALGGLSAAMFSLLAAGSEDVLHFIESVNLPFAVGYLIRMIFLSIIGAITVGINGSSINSIMVSYQVGMSVPALITSVINNSTQVRVITNSFHAPYFEDSHLLPTMLHYIADNSSNSTANSAARDVARGIGIGVDAFPLIFACVLGMTMFSAVISVYLASRGADTQRVNSLIETYSTTWKLGFGAIIGLLSGRAIG